MTEHISLKKSEETSFKLKANMFTYEAGDWIPATWEKILDVSLKNILEGNLRFILQLFIENKPFYLVSHLKDEEAMHKKHSQSPVINLKQLYGFLKKSSIDPAWLELLPKVFIALNEFPSAKVVK